MPHRDDTEIPSAEARDRLSEILNRAGLLKERIVLTRYGKGLAAVVPIEDLETIEAIEAIEDRLDLEDARTAAAEAEQKGSRSWHDVKAELGL